MRDLEVMTIAHSSKNIYTTTVFCLLRVEFVNNLIKSPISFITTPNEDTLHAVIPVALKCV